MYKAIHETVKHIYIAHEHWIYYTNEKIITLIDENEEISSYKMETLEDLKIYYVDTLNEFLAVGVNMPKELEKFFKDIMKNFKEGVLND